MVVKEFLGRLTRLYRRFAWNNGQKSEDLSINRFQKQATEIALNRSIKEMDEIIERVREIEGQASLLALNAEADFLRSTRGTKFSKRTSVDFGKEVFTAAKDLSSSIDRLMKESTNEETDSQNQASDSETCRPTISKGGLTLIRCRDI